MKFITLIFLPLIFSMSSWAEIKVHLEIDKSDPAFTCGARFKGVLQPQGRRKKGDITLRISTEGFSGSRIRYTVSYTNAGYKDIALPQNVSFKTRSERIRIPIYEIADQLPYAVNHVFVTATDGTDTANASFNYTIFRDLILEKSKNSEDDCFTMTGAEKITGINSNPSSQNRDITIQDDMGRSYSENRTFVVGWDFNVSPMQMVNLGMHMNYIRSKSNSVYFGTNVRITTIIRPGEAVVLFRQSTLFKDAYDVYKVDSCGNREKSGRAIYNRMLFSYPVAVVDLTAENPFLNLDLGYNDQLNTCKETPVAGAHDDIFVVDKSDDDQPVTNIRFNNNRTFNNLNKDLIEKDEKEIGRNDKFVDKYKALSSKEEN